MMKYSNVCKIYIILCVVFLFSLVRPVIAFGEKKVSSDISLESKVNQMLEENKKNNLPKKFVIRFIGDVTDENVDRLIDTIYQAINYEDPIEITLVISSAIGNSGAGIAAYNYIKSLPKSITIKTHNISTLGIAGILIYCAGSERSSSSIAQFIIQQSTMGMNSNKITAGYLRETYEWNKSYNDMTSQVMALTTNKNVSDVNKILLDGKTFNPIEAKKWGMVHKIKELTFDGTEFIGTVSTKNN